jgi:hypothetical protein
MSRTVRKDKNKKKTKTRGRSYGKEGGREIMKFAQTLYIIASILMIVEWLLCTFWHGQCVLSVSGFWLGVVCSWAFVLIYWLPMVVLGSWLKEDRKV